MGVLIALFWSIFLSFPLGVIVRLSVSEAAFVYPIDIAVLLFVLYGTYMLMQSNKKISWFGGWKYFVIVAALSLIVNGYRLELREFIVASFYYFRFVVYILVIPIIVNLFDKKDIKKLLIILSSGVGLSVILGLVQYFLYPDLRNLTYLGWDEHLYRIFSSFLDPNFASLIFVSLFWILNALLFLEKKKYFRYSYRCIQLISIIAVLLTYSRTGYIALISSAILYVVITKKYKIVAFIALAVICSYILLPKNLQSEGVNLFRTASIYARMEAYKISLQTFYQNPIIGVGFNSYRYLQTSPSKNKDLVSTSHAGAGVANSYLFILATTGIFGLTAFAYVILHTAKAMKNIPQNIMRNSLYAFFTAILVGSLTENILFYSFILILLSVVMGIIGVVTGDNER